MNISEFKDGVADALLMGTRNEDYHSNSYKQGYDFGIFLYCEIQSADEDKKDYEFVSKKLSD